MGNLSDTRAAPSSVGDHQQSSPLELNLPLTKALEASGVDSSESFGDPTRSGAELVAKAVPSDVTEPIYAVGQKIGVYVLEEKLGEGGMGTVWKTRQAMLDRSVALKLLPK